MTHARLTRAMHEGGVRDLDERGLMPLAAARAHLAATRVFEKGAGEGILDSDRTWAALLSLADAAELCAVATRLEWAFEPRGMDNIDLWLRYGDGIVPWLATRIVDGVLVNKPWCVAPCLLACSSPDAFALLWSARNADRLLHEWIERHVDVASRALAALDDPRARAERAAMQLRGLVPGAPLPATAEQILAHLDAWSLGRVSSGLQLWPSEHGHGAQRCHALRAIAARDGDAWGLAIDRLEGDRPRGVYPARIATYAYGPRVAARGAALVARPLAAAPAGDFASWIRSHTEDALGDPAAALPALGMPDGRIVAVIPALANVEPGAAASSSAVFVALARALAQ